MVSEAAAIPQMVPLKKVGRGGGRVISIPDHWLDYWREKLGEAFEEVEIVVAESITISVRNKG